jgi:Resolvase, N terminal domain
MQRGELREAASCERIFEERISSRKEGRAELQRALEYCREGEVLVVWKLDRLGRSLKGLLGLMGELHKRGVEFRSPREASTPPHSGRQARLPRVRILGGVRARRHPREDGGGAWGGEGQGEEGRQEAGDGREEDRPRRPPDAGSGCAHLRGVRGCGCLEGRALPLPQPRRDSQRLGDWVDERWDEYRRAQREGRTSRETGLQG